MVVLDDDSFVKLRSFRYHTDRLKQLMDLVPIMVHPELLDSAIDEEEKKLKELEIELQRRNLQIEFRDKPGRENNS